MSKATQTAKTPADRREALGLSIHAAAVKMGVSPIALSKVETGAHGCSVATLDRVAQFYGITLTELVAGCEAVRGAA